MNGTDITRIELGRECGGIARNYSSFFSELCVSIEDFRLKTY